MRARYYEPTSGRFVCEDPGRHGGNWFIYGSNSPTNCADSDGKHPALLGLLAVFIMAFVACFITQWVEGGFSSIDYEKCAIVGIVSAAIVGAIMLVGVAAAEIGATGIGVVLTALGTSIEGANLLDAILGGATAGAITAGLVQVFKGVAKIVGGVMGRNIEISMLLNDPDVA